jgi:hypothetical protein
MCFRTDLDLLIILGLKPETPLLIYNYKTGYSILNMYMENFINRIIPIDINVSEEIYKSRTTPDNEYNLKASFFVFSDFQIDFLKYRIDKNEYER